MKPEVTHSNLVQNCNAIGHIFQVKSLDVMQWHPLPNGAGSPTQVHLMITTDAVPYPLVIRFKGPDTLRGFIKALTQHCDEVFGKE